MYYWLLIALVFQSINCSHNLYILSPTKLNKLFKNGQIILHSSAFGYTPKGVNINGLIVLSNPIDACSTIDTVQQNQTNLHMFYLTDSNNCPISKKASNIFNANGYAAIVTKTSNTTIQKHGSKVSMPVLQISENDSKILFEFIKQNPKQSIVSTIHFSNPAHKPTKGDVDVTLWMSSTDKQTYVFLNKFKDFYFKQNKKIFFEPRYALQSKGSNKTSYHLGCLSSGKYCAPELQYHSRVQGKQIVQQDLRQIIIFQQYPNMWWNYILNWRIDCLSNANIFSQSKVTQGCSNFSMVKTGIDPDNIKTLFIQSFRGPKIQIQDNQILMAELSQQQIYGIDSYPRLYINNRAYARKTGLSQSLESVQLSICQAQLPNPSPSCKQLQSKYYEEDDDEFLIMSLTILSLIFLMSVLFLVYKCIMKRRMKQQVQDQVNRVLQQYYTYEGAVRMQNI